MNSEHLRLATWTLLNDSVLILLCCPVAGVPIMQNKTFFIVYARSQSFDLVQYMCNYLYGS